MWTTKAQNRILKQIHLRSAEQKGQALIELAVFGMIALMALGYLIRIGLRLNYNQAARMGAFRVAERSAKNIYQDARAVETYYGSSRQVPDPADNFMVISRERAGGGGYVTWSPHLTYSDLGQDATLPRVIVNADASQGAGTNIDAGLIVSSSSISNTGSGSTSQNESSSSMSSSTSSSFSIGGAAAGAGPSSVPSSFSGP